MMPPNKPDAVNPAIASQLQSEHHWRGVTDPERSAKEAPMRRFKDRSVASVFVAYPAAMRSKLMALRELILATATQTAGVGPVEEALKWGQPSYLTPSTHSGSTIRIGPFPPRPGEYAIFFHCQTSLVDTFKKHFGSTFRYSGNRALVFSASDRLPESELSECIATALTYHLEKKGRRVPIGMLIR